MNHHRSREEVWVAGNELLIKAVIQSCAVCMTTKSPHSPSIGKLRPFLNPNRRLSQIAVDFVMDLPASKGYTSVLVVVDRNHLPWRLWKSGAPPHFRFGSC